MTTIYTYLIFHIFIRCTILWLLMTYYVWLNFTLSCKGINGFLLAMDRIPLLNNSKQVWLICGLLPRTFLVPSSYLERILDVPCPNLPRSYSVPTPYLLLTFRLTIPCYLLAIGLFETYYPRSLKFF